MNISRHGAHAHASVVLMCGLPGSGKSSFASAMMRNIKHNNSAAANTDDVHVDVTKCAARTCSATRTRIQYDPIVLVDYDEIANGIASIAYSETETARIAMRAELEAATRTCAPPAVQLHGAVAFTETDLQAWRDCRNAALSKLETELRDYFARQTNERHPVGAHADNNYNNNSNNSNLLVILDDNFHLRSMRRDAYKVCQRVISDLNLHVSESDTTSTNQNRNHDNMSMCNMCRCTIGFSVVLVDTPLDTCLKRNSLREGKARMPEETVRKMLDTLEKPEANSGDYMKKFETNAIVIDYSGDRDEEIGTDDLYSLFGDTVQACLEAARKNPVIPPQKEEKVDPDPEALQRAREQTKKSRIHQADRLLRNLVGAVGRTDKSMGRSANDARKYVLQQVREEIIAAGADTCAYQNDIADAFRKCLENEKGELGSSGVLLAIDEACSLTGMERQ